MNPQKKNIFIIQNTELGSHMPLSVYLTELLASSILFEKHNINIICAKSDNIPNPIVKNANNIFQINTNLYKVKDNIRFSWRAYKVLKKHNKTSKIDILHCLYPNSSLLAASLFKIFINRKTKIIYDIRSPWIEMSFARKHVKSSWLKKSIMHLSEKLLCLFSDHFVFITNGLKDYYQDKYKVKAKNNNIIPSGVNTKIFKDTKTNIRDKYGITETDKLLGIVSTLGKEREYDFIINSLTDIVKNKDLKLMFVGDGPDKNNLEELTRDLNIQNKVIFTGKVPHKKVPEYISSFNIGICHLPDIFVFRNSFPLKILEYLSCGVPVLTSDIKTHREISQDFNSVYIYKDGKDLIDKVKEIKKSHFNNEIMDKLKNKYDWEALGRNYNEIYGVI